MQLKLDHHEGQQQISFRGSDTFRSPTQMPQKGEQQFDILTMQTEIRDLRSKLKIKEESIGFEKEQSQNVLQKVDKMNETFKNEVTNVRKENH